MKKRALRNWFVIWLALSPSLFAVELTVWKPEANGPKLILPVPDGGEASEAAATYLENLYAATDLHSAMKSEWLSEVSGKFSDVATSKGPVFIVLDNSFEDRLEEVRAFERAGATTYLIPLGAELALSSAAERREFRQLLAETADAMVAIGGADIDPSLYGHDLTYAFNTNVRRDKMELAILKEYLNGTSKPLFGLCRGHQLIGVLHGYSLIQDLEDELGATGHGSGNHWIEIVEGSVLAGFLGGELSVKVNTLHHQAVDLSSKPRGRLYATAYEGEGDTQVAEAMESKDGRVVTVQFHPELMNNQVGRAVMEGFVERVR